MSKSIHSLVVAKWWYSHSVFSFIFISWNTFIKRTFPSSSIHLPSCIIHIEKEDKCLIFFPLFSVFGTMSWLTSIFLWCLLVFSLFSFFLPQFLFCLPLFLSSSLPHVSSLLSFSLPSSPFCSFFPAVPSPPLPSSFHLPFLLWTYDFKTYLMNSTQLQLLPIGMLKLFYLWPEACWTLLMGLW